MDVCEMKIYVIPASLLQNYFVSLSRTSLIPGPQTKGVKEDQSFHEWYGVDTNTSHVASGEKRVDILAGARRVQVSRVGTCHGTGWRVA